MSDRFDHIVFPGYDPLGTYDFIASAKQIPFQVTLEGDMSWMKTRQQINRELENLIEGMFDTVLTSPSDSSTVEFTIFVEEEFEEKIKKYLEYRKWL